MKYAIYMRVASAEQLSRDCCDMHMDALTNYAEKNELEVVEKYSDVGFSGNNLNRPGLQSLITDYNAGKFEGVLTTDLTRISRKPMAFPFPIKTIK